MPGTDIRRERSGFRNLQIPADLTSQIVVDLFVAGNRRRLPEGAIDVNAVVAAFPEKLATVSLEVTDQTGAFHAEILRGSRMTS